MSEQCKATTTRGERCQNEAKDDGYCWIESHCQSHDPDTHTRNPQYDPERVAEAIRLADGNLTQAAKNFGISRDTVHRYCNEFDVCKAARDEARDTLVDLARSTYRDVMEDEDAEWSDKLKAADQVTDKYDRDVEPEKHKIDGDHTHSGGISVSISHHRVTDEDMEDDD